MVGNLYEWVADWVPRATGCGAWSAGVSPTGDDQCLAGAETTGEPGALLRGAPSSAGRSRARSRSSAAARRRSPTSASASAAPVKHLVERVAARVSDGTRPRASGGSCRA
jgi:hypothetical protein